jgi:hypothetical protein
MIMQPPIAGAFFARGSDSQHEFEAAILLRRFLGAVASRPRNMTSDSSLNSIFGLFCFYPT